MFSGISSIENVWPVRLCSIVLLSNTESAKKEKRKRKRKRKIERECVCVCGDVIQE